MIDGRTCLQSDVSCARLLEDVMRQLEIFNEKLAIDRCATPRDRKAHKARVHWQASTRSRGSSGVTTTCNSTSTSTRTLETSTTTSSVSTGNSMRDSPIPDESTHGESRFAPCGRFVSSRKMFATRKQSDAAMRPPPKYQCHTHTRFPHIDSSSLARGVQKEKNHGINEISLLSGRSTDESVSTLVSPRERIRLASERSVSASVASPSVIYVKPTPIVVTKMLTGLFIDSPRSPTGTQRSSTSSFSSASSAFSSGFSSLSPSK